MINGVINVYKERGFTSHDVVAKLRGILNQKKIGHTGTLDPEATGVLPVCLGKATKLCDMLTDKSKSYEAEFTLGITTDTQDIWGSILRQTEVSVTEEQVASSVLSFLGEQMQIPPMYSALKVNGKKLYELAREGKTVERQPRKVFFYDITISKMELPKVTIRVHCSKGTYIRTLCQDIGEKLGCGACMSSLIRTQVERFELEGSLTLSEIEKLVLENRILDRVVPIEQMFDEYVAVTMKTKFDLLVYNGNRFYKEQVQEYFPEQSETALADQQKVRVYDSQKQFLAIFQYCQQGEYFAPVKMFIET